MKKTSLVIIIISCVCIVISQTMELMNGNAIFHKMLALSFIGFGIGSIMFGAWLIKKK